MTGDALDIADRLRRYLPRWFGPGPTPRLDALLAGIAVGLAFTFDLYAFAKLQVRIATSTGGWLDLTAFSFLGERLPRFHRETEDGYRERLRREIFRDRNTRPSGIAILTELGVPPAFVFEGWYAPANGGRGSGRFAYSRAGRWGSRHAPAQVIFHVPLPQNYGIPNRGGRGSVTLSGAAVGGYGDGNYSYVDDSEITGQGPSRTEIIQRLESVRTDGVKYFVTFIEPF